MLFVQVLLILILLLLIFFFIIKPLCMANNTISRYHFSVQWGGSRIGFTEVSGLDIEIEAVSFRDGSDPENSFRKIPGLRKFTDITLKRGIVKGDNELFEWLNTEKIGTIERRDVTISLLDENHAPVVIWRLKNAFPVKYQGPVLNAADSCVAIETLVLTHEGITVEKT
ncbi:hypothetical protein BH11BAC5_BH11BAC5_45880 [soil metagenome]